MKERRGFFTSEFVIVVLNSIITVLIAAGVLSADEGQQVVDSTVQLINALTEFIGVIAPIIGMAYYTWSRTKVKIG